jgi:hypothetical protein
MRKCLKIIPTPGLVPKSILNTDEAAPHEKFFISSEIFTEYVFQPADTGTVPHLFDRASEYAGPKNN